jgi:hypothetical protein
MALYLTVHVFFGAFAGIALHHLIAAGRRGKFSLANWTALGALYVLVFCFADYVGGHVRNKTFDSDIQKLSVALMVVGLVAGYFLRARFASSKQP